jgi:hypothetical protein
MSLAVRFGLCCGCVAVNDEKEESVPKKIQLSKCGKLDAFSFNTRF